MNNNRRKKGLFKTIIEEAKNYIDGQELTICNFVYLLFLNPSYQLILLYRITHKLHGKFGRKRLLWLIPKILLYIEKVLIGSYIDPEATIGQGFRIMYGMGIIIGAKVKIGNNVTIFNGVTLGSTFPGLLDIKQPKIGDYVFIGSGAKVLGGIVIGDNVKIGANAVVLKSFGPNITIAGVPAKIVKKGLRKNAEE